MKHTLRIQDLHISVEKKEILQGVSMVVHSGEVHAIMGPNGGGKSTFSYSLMGHPAYTLPTVKTMKVTIDDEDILSLTPEDRAKKGLFLAFQSPMAIPGVTVVNLLRTAYQETHKETEQKAESSNPGLNRRWKSGGMTLSEFTKKLKEYGTILHMDDKFFTRGIHDGFSGGEKKKLEMLQALMLEPKFAIFDEIDTGLDVDALKIVANGIDLLRKQGTGVIVITHYQRILQYVKPDFVHVLVKGVIAESGISALAKKIEEEGYKAYEV